VAAECYLRRTGTELMTDSATGLLLSSNTQLAASGLWIPGKVASVVGVACAGMTTRLRRFLDENLHARRRSTRRCLGPNAQGGDGRLKP
jgi:hypothetical protein